MSVAQGGIAQAGPVCHANGIRGYGALDTADIMVVGIAPGAQEVKAGRPFVGPSGQILTKLLPQLGVALDDVYFTNLVCTRQDKPTRAQILACHTRLRAEIAAVRPFLIVTLSALVAEVFQPGRKFGEIRGVPILQKTTWGECYYMATYHPSAALHGTPGAINDIVRDLAKIPLIMDRRAGLPLSPTTYLLDESDNPQRFLDELPRDKLVGIDIETEEGEGEGERISLFDEKTPYRLRSVAFAVEGNSVAYGVTADVAKTLRWPLDVQWVMHNGQFDAQGFRSYLNTPITFAHDTMLMSYILDERAGRHRLKTLAREYLDAGFYEESVNPAALEHFSDAEVIQYNGADAYYTANLPSILLPMMDADDVRRPYEEILLPAANAFTEISYRGIAYSPEAGERLRYAWYPKYIEQSIELIEMGKELGFINPSAQKQIHPTERDLASEKRDEFDWAGHPDTINLHSPKQIAHLLYDILKLPPPANRRSTDRAALEALEGHHPFVDKLLLFRRFDKVLGDYLRGGSTFIGNDKRFHPNVLLHGTRTGRLSYRDPALQTIPQEHTVGAWLSEIRDLFTTTNEDYVLVGVDYEKAEVYTAAYLSGDPQMLADLQSGDYHAQVAVAAFGVSIEYIQNTIEGKALRQLAKKITFGILYGSGAAGLSVSMRCAVSTAEQYLRRFHARYPTYVRWAEEQRRIVMTEGELQTVAGRKRRYYFIAGTDAGTILNQAMNTPVQSAASDVCLTSLIELHQKSRTLAWRWAYHVILSLHDANYFEVRRDRLDDVLPLIVQTMQRPRLPGLGSIPVEVKVGTSLYSLKKVEVAT